MAAKHKLPNIGYMYFHLFRRPVRSLPLSLASHRHARGFTLMEVMVVVAIMGILAALAAPSFTPLIERWRVRQATEQLHSSLYYARSEAIKRGGGVVMRKLPNGTNGCTDASTTTRWSCGWFICEDTDGNGECGPSEPVLQRVDAPPRMTIVRTSTGENISFNRWGLIGGSYIGFNVIPLDKTLSDPNARGVCMSSGGRVRTVPQEDVPCTS